MPFFLLCCLLIKAPFEIPRWLKIDPRATCFLIHIQQEGHHCPSIPQNSPESDPDYNSFGHMYTLNQS